MPFSGYLKIPDIDGQVQSVEAVIDRYDTQLTDDADVLLRTIAAQDDVDSFNFATVTYDTPGWVAQDQSLNIGRATFDYATDSQGAAAYAQAMAYADDLETQLQDDGLQAYARVGRGTDGGPEILVVEVTDLNADTATLGAGAGGFDFLL